ncbi:hypothetical protein NMG60_11036171 [Bertholletia excelsa]
MAKLAEQAERYEETVENMKNIAKLDVEMTVEERNFLSKEESKKHEGNVKLIKEYRLKVEGELSKVCNDILSIIDKHLIPSSKSADATVFFYNIYYCRYRAEFKVDEDRKDAAGQAQKAYEAASATSSTDLPSTRRIRLGLALNLSIFYSEILNSPERACHLAKQAFDEAIAELDMLSEESYKDSTLIMQLLRDNLPLWTSDLPGEGGDDNSKVEEPKAAESQITVIGNHRHIVQ